MIHKTVIDTAVKITWKSRSSLKIGKLVMYGAESNMAVMPVLLGEFGELTLHGAN